jgi:S-adenosylmethionine:tRNA ribosyltransferase-isomerase
MSATSHFQPQTSLPANLDPQAEPNSDLSLRAYDYNLPPECIAQNPVVPRDTSRLLVVSTTTTHQHCVFRDLPERLQASDLLVLNDSRVLAARLYGQTDTGARVEVLLLEENNQGQWLALVKPGKRFKQGVEVEFEPMDVSPQPERLRARVLERDEATSGRWLEFNLPTGRSLLPYLEFYGQVPLPPYVTGSEAAPEQYQTVYAQRLGSAAAPTAGLHFTPELFDRLQAAGIQTAFITLHVGVGTFRPVEAEDIRTHQMHGEWLEIKPEVVDLIQQTKANGGRIIAVGTTSTRALEGAAQTGILQPYCGKTNLYIYPGYQWRVVEGLITNFHLPKSSLMMLVSALMGRQRLLQLYEEAIAHEYRFYSFGDAMLILPEARL